MKCPRPAPTCPNTNSPRYLREGADGGRLDTAFELGHACLRDLTDAAHREKPGWPVEAQRPFAFERHTDKALDTRIVVVNPSASTVRERLLVANSHLMDDTPMVDVLGLVPTPAPLASMSFGPGFITVEVPPQGVLVLQPRPKALGGYNRYKRVQ